jgi:hypothetical protein
LFLVPLSDSLSDSFVINQDVVELQAQTHEFAVEMQPAAAEERVGGQDKQRAVPPSQLVQSHGSECFHLETELSSFENLRF